jgi:L-asparaginase
VSTLLIYTGGTIGMIKRDQGSLAPFSLNEMLTHCPVLAAKVANQQVECLTLQPVKDSTDINPDNWISLRNLILSHHTSHENVLILHGTDTMAYSSSALSFLMLDFNKNIVFTGSQIPIWEENSDGNSNIIHALQVLDQLVLNKVRAQTLLCFNGKTFKGNRVSKISTSSFDAFSGSEFMFTEEQHPSKYNGVFKYIEKIETDVSLIKMYPGIQLENLIDYLLATPPKGILLESFGTGNIPTNNSFKNGLKKLIANGVIVLNISQCSGGYINMEKYESGLQLLNIGVINGKNMSGEAAISKLMMTLSISGYSKAEILITTIAGETTTA